jgi:hypothetical protein
VYALVYLFVIEHRCWHYETTLCMSFSKVRGNAMESQADKLLLSLMIEKMKKVQEMSHLENNRVVYHWKLSVTKQRISRLLHKRSLERLRLLADFSRLSHSHLSK